MLANDRGGRGRGLTVVPTERKVPPLPIPAKDAHPRVKAVWRSFFRSKVSWAVDLDADRERLYRWVAAMQEREELMDQVRADGWMVPGSQSRNEVDEQGKVIVWHQMVLNPLLNHVKHLDKVIESIAGQFGLTPMSRFRLQLTVSEAGQSAERWERAQLQREQDEAEERPQRARLVNLE